MKKITLLLIISVISISCQQKKLDAKQIIDKAIEASGGKKYDSVTISFNFRDKHYKSTRKNGQFQLERYQEDSLGNKFVDKLTNNNFARTKNEMPVTLADSTVNAYSNSVNSVHYFVQLPYGLNGNAVNKKLLGKDSIKGKEYYEIKISFDQDGGGTDYEDEYLYWINTNTFMVDYLAYSYHVNEGGIRFRVAFNPRIINGIRFVDYKNYAEDDLSTPLESLDELYEAGELELFSEIITEDVEVSF